MKARQEFISAQDQMLSRYDVAAHSKFIDIPSIDGRAHVLISGEGPSVVMISGIGTPGAIFAPLMAELEGFRLHVVDLPGYGLTDTTPAFADDLKHNAVGFIRDVLNGLDLQSPVFIANSLGSLWTSWFALEHPEKLEGIVHLGCPAVVFDTSAPLPMRLLSVKPLGRFLTWLQPPSEQQVEQLSKTVGEYPLVPELSELLLRTEQLPDYRHMLLSTLNKLIHLRGNRPEMRLTPDQLARIKHPTLILWGKDDPFGAPETGERMVEHLPDARLHIIEGGHAPWLKQSKEIGPMITEFLHHFDQ